MTNILSLLEGLTALYKQGYEDGQKANIREPMAPFSMPTAEGKSLDDTFAQSISNLFSYDGTAQVPLKEGD